MTVISQNNCHGSVMVKQTLEPDCLPLRSCVTWACYTASLDISLWSSPSHRAGGRIPRSVFRTMPGTCQPAFSSIYPQLKPQIFSSVKWGGKNPRRSVFFLILYPGCIKCQFWQSGIIVLGFLFLGYSQFLKPNSALTISIILSRPIMFSMPHSRLADREMCSQGI